MNDRSGLEAKALDENIERVYCNGGCWVMRGGEGGICEGSISEDGCKIWRKAHDARETIEKIRMEVLTR
jgi:hypothetical protein